MRCRSFKFIQHVEVFSFFLINCQILKSLQVSHLIYAYQIFIVRSIKITIITKNSASTNNNTSINNIVGKYKVENCILMDRDSLRELFVYHLKRQLIVIYHGMLTCHLFYTEKLFCVSENYNA